MHHFKIKIKKIRVILEHKLLYCFQVFIEKVIFCSMADLILRGSIFQLFSNNFYYLFLNLFYMYMQF